MWDIFGCKKNLDENKRKKNIKEKQKEKKEEKIKNKFKIYKLFLFVNSNYFLFILTFLYED